MGTIVSFGINRTESVQSAFLWMAGCMLFITKCKQQKWEGETLDMQSSFSNLLISHSLYISQFELAKDLQQITLDSKLSRSFNLIYEELSKKKAWMNNSGTEQLEIFLDLWLDVKFYESLTVFVIYYVKNCDVCWKFQHSLILAVYLKRNNTKLLVMVH